MAKTNGNISLDTQQKLNDRLRWAEAECAALACESDLGEDFANLASSALSNIMETRELLKGKASPDKKLKLRIGAIVDKHIALAPHERKPLVKELASELAKAAQDPVVSYQKFVEYRKPFESMPLDLVYNEYHRREWVASQHAAGSVNFGTYKTNWTEKGLREFLAALSLYDDICVFESESE